MKKNSIFLLRFVLITSGFCSLMNGYLKKEIYATCVIIPQESSTALSFHTGDFKNIAIIERILEPKLFQAFKTDSESQLETDYPITSQLTAEYNLIMKKICACIKKEDKNEDSLYCTVYDTDEIEVEF